MEGLEGLDRAFQRDQRCQDKHENYHCAPLQNAPLEGQVRFAVVDIGQCEVGEYPCQNAQDAQGHGHTDLVFEIEHVFSFV